MNKSQNLIIKCLLSEASEKLSPKMLQGLASLQKSNNDKYIKEFDNTMQLLLDLLRSLSKEDLPHKKSTQIKDMARKLSNTMNALNIAQHKLAQTDRVGG